MNLMTMSFAGTFCQQPTLTIIDQFNGAIWARETEGQLLLIENRKPHRDRNISLKIMWTTKW